MNVKFTYFKETGKYYSEGYVQVKATLFHAAVDEVQQLLDGGTRPGLVDGTHFNTYCEFYTEYGPLPHLFVR